MNPEDYCSLFFLLQLAGVVVLAAGGIVFLLILV